MQTFLHIPGAINIQFLSTDSGFLCQYPVFCKNFFSWALSFFLIPFFLIRHHFFLILFLNTTQTLYFVVFYYHINTVHVIWIVCIFTVGQRPWAPLCTLSQAQSCSPKSFNIYCVMNLSSFDSGTVHYELTRISKR
jgi:hypothetical protein